MPNQPCPVKLNECPCFDDDPFTNLSSEAPDREVFIANVNYDGTNDLTLNQIFGQLGCFEFCESPISQEAADDCAAAQAAICAWGTWRFQGGTGGGGSPMTIFANRTQSCNVQCPDGSNFGFTVAAGTVFGLTQEAADSKANALACQRARLHRICVSPGILNAACQGGLYFQTLQVSGGAGPYQFSILSGSLPSGFTLNATNGTISGVTNDAAHVAVFTVQVHDANGFTAQKAYSLTVVSNTTTVADAQIGTAYSQQMTIGPAHDASTEVWTSFGAPLPAGLTLSPSGLISGTPTDAAGSYPLLLDVKATFPGVSGTVDCVVPVTLVLKATFDWNLVWVTQFEEIGDPPGSITKTFTPSTFHNILSQDNFVATFTEANYEGDQTYTGPATNCNLHLIISANAGTAIATVDISVASVPVLHVPDTAAGVYDFPFTIPLSVAALVQVKLHFKLGGVFPPRNRDWDGSLTVV